MADERELDEQVQEAEDGAEDSATQAATPESESRQTPKSEVVIPDDYNWDNHPGFREWKRKMEQDKAAVEQRYQQMMAQQAQELRNRQMSEMDDYQRLEFELNETRQREQMAYQRLQEVEVQTAKQRALSEVSQTMGVPVDILMEAQDINEAWRMAAQYQRQSEQRRAEQAAAAAAQKAAARQDKQQRNAVDTGGGGRPIPTDDWGRDYEKFKQSGNSRGFFAHALDSK